MLMLMASTCDDVIWMATQRDGGVASVDEGKG